MEKLAHFVAFLLLASLFQPLTARELEIDVLQLDVSQSGCPGVKKDTWPELLGVPSGFARRTIKHENPKLTNVPSVLNGSPVTADFRCDRVRLVVNVLGFIVKTPQVG
ncbi:Ethylene-responsive proteinase inhibitor 1 [Capsicum baccatum]|uniref:Ethylene-responsive proteinase inhibitor 1 n=1 Tax=Capsicum baccatum TaxID=33114 RepID=A0A2G2WG66_CAPBA|nr:Ethylene-responsive proteinase inhibitor 1 [Capsicum baccatum]